MIKKIIKKIFALIESMRPITSLLALAGAYVGGIVADAPYYSFPLILSMIVVFLSIGGSMSFNDFYDREIDIISHPNRPIPSKRLSAKESLYFSYILFGIALVISLFINWICFGILVFSLIALYSYELYLKNIGLIGNFLVAFLSSITFTFGGAAVGKPFASILLSMITFFLFFGREILKDVQDVKGDAISRKTLPMKMGERDAVFTGSIMLIIALFISPLPYLFNLLGVGYLSIIFIVDLICIYAVIKSLRNFQNAESTVSLLRSASALGVIAIIIGVII